MTPSNIGEMATHISYMRRDIDEMKGIQRDMNTKLDQLGTQYVERTEFLEHLKADADHEARIRAMENNKTIAEIQEQTAVMRDQIELLKKIVYGCISIILVAVISALIYLVIKH